MQNDGLRVASPEILARMSRGELVPFDSYHFRTAPRFETAEPSLKWLERATFVGVAARTPDRVAIGFHGSSIPRGGEVAARNWTKSKENQRLTFPTRADIQRPSQRPRTLGPAVRGDGARQVGAERRAGERERAGAAR